MGEPVTLRWLGVAGIELRASGRTLLIDPFVTRPPGWRLWLGQAQPDTTLSARMCPWCDALVVTHPHWDHVMDAPEVARRTGAQVYGSANTCHLLAILGVPGERLHEVAGGACFRTGPFAVEALAALHSTLLGRPILAGAAPSTLSSPPRLREYRMDCDLSFRIHVQGYRLLDWSSETSQGAVPADVLLVKPFSARAYYGDLLGAVRPRVVVPIHWDDFFRPLSKPVRPMMRYPRWRIPPLRRLDLDEFRVVIASVAPQTPVFVPRMFEKYELSDLL
jgi:L-ascorbate metabolism protein UlaG (beta-lactamase superfamily)